MGPGHGMEQSAGSGQADHHVQELASLGRGGHSSGLKASQDVKMYKTQKTKNMINTVLPSAKSPQLSSTFSSKLHWASFHGSQATRENADACKVSRGQGSEMT